MIYTVGIQLQTLHREQTLTDYVRQLHDKNPPPLGRPENLHILLGYTKQVRVLASAKGKKKTSFHTLLYYGPLVNLTFDPKNYQWSDSTPFMEYMAKLGRSLLQKRLP
jgi:hypothetical protein